MDKVYNITYSGTFYGEARITASSEEEAYEIASDLTDCFDINTTICQYDVDGQVEEVTISYIEEEEPDYEEDYEEDL
jgi:hypothetical protein|nr:MAG TPA: PcfM DpnD/PcfM-like protein [Caudoviricetes sp.]